MWIRTIKSGSYSSVALAYDRRHGKVTWGFLQSVVVGAGEARYNERGHS